MIRADWYMLVAKGGELPKWYADWRKAQGERSGARNEARAKLANSSTTKPTDDEAAERRRGRVEHKRPRLLRARAKIIAELQSSIARNDRQKIGIVRVSFSKLSAAKQKQLRKRGRNFCPVWVRKQTEVSP